jgi:hypothetical protein
MTSDCCFEPGFARWLRRKVSSVADLKKPHIRTLLKETFGNMPVTNIRTEDRFARQNAQQYVCHGRVPSNGTAASRHILTEAQLWHHVSMEELHAKQPNAPAIDELSNPRSGWNVFVKEKGGDLKTTSVGWARLPAAERRAYDEQAAQQRDAFQNRPERAPVTMHAQAVQASPLKLGDAEYPLRPSSVEEATASLNQAQKRWTSLVGNVMAADSRLVFKDVYVPQCCDMYGEGVCISDWDRQKITSFSACKRTLWALARINRTMNGKLTNMLLVSIRQDLRREFVVFRTRSSSRQVGSRLQISEE